MWWIFSASDYVCGIILNSLKLVQVLFGNTVKKANTIVQAGYYKHIY